MEKTKKRILLVTFEFPPKPGGVENYYYNLIKKSTQYDFVVLTLPYKKASDFDTDQKFTIIREKLLYRFFYPKWFKLFILIKKIVSREKIDIIWVGDILPVGNACYLISKLYKIPYFISTHGMDIMLPQKNKRKELIMKKVLKKSLFITTNSKYTKLELNNLNIDDTKLKIVYPAPCITDKRYKVSEEDIDVELDRHDIRDKFKLITIGRIVRRKGHKLVIKILPELLNSNPDIVYLVAGTGDYQKELEKLVIKLNLENNVIFLGKLSNKELATYYKLSDLFVMPSIVFKKSVEGFGITFVEAACYGKPSIGGVFGGEADAILDGKTGYLCDGNDLNALYETLLKTLNNNNYKQLGNNALAFSKNFSWNKIVKKYIELI